MRRQLQVAGLDVVLDKGRGIGGRMATRRVELVDRPFDLITERNTSQRVVPTLKQLLGEVTDSAMVWSDAGKPDAYTGIPACRVFRKH